MLVAQEQRVGLVQNEKDAFKGYTLFAPLFSTTTYLIDMEGRVVNRWESDHEPGQSAYLLENGNLLRTAFPGPESSHTFHGGGSGGKVQEFTWDGKLVWEFTCSNDSNMLHHDIARLSNGNILMIAWERKTPQEAAKAGRNPKKLGEEGLWSEQIIEVKPFGATTGEIVWKWHAWNHLVQDRIRTLPNYGKIADHPGRININPFDWNEQLSEEDREKLTSLGYLSPSQRLNERDINPDWLHINSIAYNDELDQIVLSVLGFNEIWIIDHAISTEEAAGPKGDLLYRWGNPQAYGRGTSGDQQLFAQHDAHWIKDGLKGAGHLLLFNNGRGRPVGDFSSVDEIIPPLDEAGHYRLDPNRGFGPTEPVWSYTASERSEFYSTHISGAQRLPNGNTFICSGEKGILFEVTPVGEAVWKYINPVKGGKRPPPGMGRPGRKGPPRNRPNRNKPPRKNRLQDKTEPENCVFRAYRYGLDYAAFKGKDLFPGETVEALITAKTTEESSDQEGDLVLLNKAEFEKIVSPSAKVEKLAEGMQFTEGPVWIKEGGYLLFSDIPADEIKKWKQGELTTFRKPSRNTNGNLLDEKGRLLCCEHGSRSVTRTLEDGKVETLVDRYQGKRFNSPNDLAVRSDGVIWFTDPPYGLARRERELEDNNVFHFKPKTGELRSVARDFDRPNGLCLSPDEKKLYIADSGKPAHIRVFDVHEDGALSKGKVFCEIDIGAPDGIRCDAEGRIFSSAGDGVHVFLPSGELVGKIFVKERPSNLCFGGEQGRTLFITARTSLYAISLK